MSFNATLSDALARNANMLEHHLSDFSDADLFVRPVAGANHAMWQLAHIAFFTGLIARVVAPGATLPEVPKLAAATAKGSHAIDEVEAFPSKIELVGLLRESTRALIVAIQQMTEADLSHPSPADFKSFAPTYGQLLLAVPLHLAMHVGQIQVIRRRLGKPILF